jgi:hypothetical protein
MLSFYHFKFNEFHVIILFEFPRNLICVYSKKHMDDVPELVEMKRKSNTRSLKEMALRLRYLYFFALSV